MLAPDVGQGYLVLNKSEYPNVKTWVIAVKTRTFNQNNQPIDRTLDQVTLKNGDNYWYVPDKTRESVGVRFLEVSGEDVNGTPLVTQGSILVSHHPERALQPGGSVFEPECDWVCNGSYYAWKVQQYVDGTQPTVGPSILKVEQALNYNASTEMATPNYRYITQSEFNNTCLNSSGNNVGGYFVSGVPCNPDGFWMTDPISIPQGSTDYKDINGNTIAWPTIVRGVGKPLADWGEGNPITTPELQFGNTVCPNDKDWAMNQVNINAPTLDGYPIDGTGTNFYPDLACNQLTSGGAPSPSPGGIKPLVWRSTLLKELFGTGSSGSSGNNWNPFVNGVVAKVKGTTPNSGLSWQEEIDKCVIRSLSKPSNPIIEIDPANPLSFTNGFTLEAGLYNFGFAIKDVGYEPIIFEVEKKLVVSTALSDFLSVSIYPVPILNNKFTLEMEAAENLQFTNEFRDSGGTLLYSNSFGLRKGQQWKHDVMPRNGIPSGTYINRFVFTDGSVLALQTIK